MQETQDLRHSKFLAMRQLGQLLPPISMAVCSAASETKIAKSNF
jgi:hypothetical protein